MKYCISLLFAFLLSCTKDSPNSFTAQLPPETQTGANTFGCIINGQVFYPRDGTSSIFSPGGKGLKFWGDPSGNRQYNEFEIFNLQDGMPCSRMVIHMQNLHQIQLGEYIWQPSNFQNSIDGLMQNYVFAEIYDAASNSLNHYSSYENSDKVTITKYANDNTIISGNFSGKLRLINGTKEVEILGGRFDINKATLPL
jgi:hypothetical protein